MENIALFAGNSTATVDGGKLYLSDSYLNCYTPLEITFLSGFTKRVGTLGTSRVITVTPVAGNNTEYKLQLTAMKNEMTSPFGPSVVNSLFVYTSDASGSVSEIVDGLCAAIVPGLPAATNSGSANGFTVTKTGASGSRTAFTVTTVNTAEFDFSGQSLVGSLIAVVNTTTAYVAPVGVGATLALMSVPGATAGVLYTVYNSFVSKPKLTGGVTNGIDNVPVTLYFAAGSTGITALDAFIAAPFTSPAAYNL
jgi:hypothetical protein